MKDKHVELATGWTSCFSVTIITLLLPVPASLLIDAGIVLLMNIIILNDDKIANYFNNLGYKRERRFQQKALAKLLPKAYVTNNQKDRK
jgi:hypothetical protein